MTDDARELTRRRLLGAAGVAVAGLGAVGPAGASHFRQFEKVCVTVDVQAYNDACPTGSFGPIFEAGRTGRAWEFCNDDEKGEMVYFEPEPANDQPFAWVPADFLESC